MLLFIEGRWYCYKRCYKHPKTRNLCWSHSSFANSMRWVRLSEKFLFLPPLCSLLTQNREHIPLSQGHHDEGGKGGEGGRGREKKTPGEQNMAAAPPQQHTFPLLPSLPFALAFFFVQSLFPPFYTLRHVDSLSSFWLSFLLLFLTPSPTSSLYLHRGHLLHMSGLGNDKRLQWLTSEGLQNHTQFT